MIDGCGILYIQETIDSSPDWSSSFFDFDLGVFNVSNGAVLVSRPKTDRANVPVYALAFGVLGRHMINTQCIDETFGLYSALKLLDEKSIQQITLRDLSGSHMIATQQIGQGERLAGFDVNTKASMLQTITAKTSATKLGFDLGKSIQGSAALSLSAKLTTKELPARLEGLTDAVREENLREEFSWVDNLKPISDDGLAYKLTTLALENLNTGDGSLFFAPPLILDFSDVAAYRVKDQYLDDYSSDAIIKALGGTVSREDLNTMLVVLDPSGEEISSQTLSKWLCGDIATSDENEVAGTFCILDGKWYEVDDRYLNDLDNSYERIKLETEYTFSPFDENVHRELQSRRSKKTGDAAKGEPEPPKVPVISERVYLTEEAKKFDCILLDRKMVNSKEKMEVCDLLFQNAMVHVKRYHNAQALSHLFYQGIVSASVLNSSANHRMQINTMLKEMQEEGEIERGKEISSFMFDEDDAKRIVYAIIGPKDKKETKDGKESRPKLSFFCKVAITEAHQRLKDMGRVMTIAAIDVIKKSK